MLPPARVAALRVAGVGVRSGCARIADDSPAAIPHTHCQHTPSGPAPGVCCLLVTGYVRANHGGGYSYRLCKYTPGVNVTEACFKQTPLAFTNQSRVRLTRSLPCWYYTKLSCDPTKTHPRAHVLLSSLCLFFRAAYKATLIHPTCGLRCVWLGAHRCNLRPHAVHHPPVLHPCIAVPSDCFLQRQRGRLCSDPALRGHVPQGLDVGDEPAPGGNRIYSCVY